MQYAKNLPTVIAAAALIAASASGLSAQTKWDMPTPYADGNFHTKNIAQFAQEIEKGTNGALKIAVHSNGSLVKHGDIKKSVRSGTVPIGEVLISFHSNESPIYSLDSVPFLVTSYADAKKLYSVQRPALEKRLADEGLMLLYSVPWPPQGLYAKKEIKSLDDLKSIKLRTYNVLMQRMAQLAQAVPTQVEAPDVPTAFATGRVDSMISSTSSGVDYKAWEFLTHYYDTQAWLPRNMVIVNKKTFDALPAAQKTVVLNAAKAAETRGWEASAAENQAKQDIMKQNKIIVSAPTAALKKGLNDIGAKMTEEWIAKAGADGKAILDAFRKK